MQIVLRPYQEQAIEKGIRFLTSVTKADAAIQILPTGAGKSLVISGIIKGLNGERTLILQPSKEILIQNFNKYRAYGFYASVYSASLNRKEISKTVFATIGSIVKKLHLFKDVKYILIDECHLTNAKEGQFSILRRELPRAKIIGFTATPYRLSTDGYGGSILKFLTRTRPRIFKEVIYYVQNKELFDAGYLCPCQYFEVGKFDRSKIRLNTTGADFDERSLQEYYAKIDLKGNIVSVARRLMEIRKNVLVFVRYVKEASYLVSQVPGLEMVTSDMPAEKRDDILSRFRKGLLKGLVNCGIVAIGFDKPDLETVLLARETMSLALYYQWCGRGIRPFSDKASCWIVDMCGNYKLFGRIEDLHIDEGVKGKFAITSGGVPLTNEYFGEVFHPAPKEQTQRFL